MEKLEFKTGIIEVYDTKEEMIGILSEKFGRDEIDGYLSDNRFKNNFSPSADASYYIKKIVAIKVPGENMSLMCFEHWNYEEYWWTRERTEVNLNTYSSGFACISFRRPSKEVQKCFLEYYDTVRDDDRIEKVLETFKIGDKLYFANEDNTLSSETINHIAFDCKEDFVVEVGTDKRKNKFEIARVYENRPCDTHYCEKKLYPSLKDARKACLESLKETKIKYQKHICNIEKKILETMSFVG